jgi:hypothetical protein
MIESNDPPLSPNDDEQFSLFGVGENRLQAPVRSFAPDPDDVRKQLHALLAAMRESHVMPWPERDARMWLTVFPQMTNWLPEDEAVQLRFEFDREVERLKVA